MLPKGSRAGRADTEGLLRQLGHHDQEGRPGSGPNLLEGSFPELRAEGADLAKNLATPARSQDRQNAFPQ